MCGYAHVCVAIFCEDQFGAILLADLERPCWASGFFAELLKGHFQGPNLILVLRLWILVVLGNRLFFAG